MGSDEVIGWMLMVPAVLHLHLMNAAISLIPIAVIDMMTRVPPAQIRCLEGEGLSFLLSGFLCGPMLF